MRANKLSTIVQLSLLRINNVAGITIKELEVLVVSKLVYPTLQTINDEGEKEYIPNDSNKLVKLTTRKLSSYINHYCQIML